MAEDNRLTVNFELLGVKETTRILSWSIDSAYLTSTDGFEFDVLPGDKPELRDLELQPVELLLNGASQLLGRIDRTSIGAQGSVVSCAGRDYIADIVECNVDPSFQVKESMTLGDAITLVCWPCGIDSAISDGDALMENIRSGRATRKGGQGRKRVKAPLQNVKPRQGGEGIYEYVNRLTARQGLTVQPGNQRNTIVLSAPDYKQDPSGTIRVSASSRQGAKNNVISAEAVRDYSRMPTFLLAHGKQAGRSEDGAKGIRRTFDLVQAASTYSAEMGRILSSARLVQGRQFPGKGSPDPRKLYRFTQISDVDARTDDEIDASALRAVAERLKDTLSYRVTLRGHTDAETGAIWSVNTMVQVTDEIRGIDEPLWIASRKLSFSSTDGATTELECWRPDSFQIELPSD